MRLRVVRIMIEHHALVKQDFHRWVAENAEDTLFAWRGDAAKQKLVLVEEPEGLGLGRKEYVIPQG